LIDVAHYFANISCFFAVMNFRGNSQEITSYKPANELIIAFNQMLNRKGIKTQEKVKKIALQCSGYIQILFSQSDPSLIYISSRDEFELEFSGLSQAEL
jgi:hypothetical protein